jgi:SpoVK/Ycf46/Vps4 family AAA+-type ATPase
MALNCDNCGTKNRDIAKFCKKCGTKILSNSAADLEQLVGLADIKNEIKSLINIFNALKNRGTGQRINMHTIIIGAAGTGKSTIANVLQDLFFKNGIITKPKADIIDAVDYPEYTKDFQNNIQKVKGGILFIDNAQKLVPSGFAGDIHQLDKLFSEMDKFGCDPIVILAGLPEGFEEFIEKNPSIKNRFEYKFKLPEYSAIELYQICLQRLTKYNLSLNEESDKRLKMLFKQAIKTKDHSFGNGHFAVGVAEDIFKNYLSRVSKSGIDDNIVQKEDIKGNIPEEKTLEQVLAEMDEYIGMDTVKAAVKEIAQQVAMQQERTKRGLGKGEKAGVHIVLTGNPGTGKTTIARKLGEIFATIEYLDSGHVIEVDRSKLVSQYANETATLTNKLVDKAMGGILFVDEAYTLTPYSDTNDVDKYGKEAVETLMKRMEDDRGNFVLIAAGYKLEMERFLKTNPGLKSRFTKFLHIDDYKPDELLLIYKGFFKKQKYVLSEQAEEIARKAIAKLYDNRDKNFGNGREMRKLFEATIAKQAERISKIPIYEQNDDILTTILPEDIPYEAPKELDLTEIMSELNELTGMKEIKDEIKNLVNYLNIEKKRKEQGGTTTPLNIHFVFTGNPGTGKTTVARIIGKVFKNLGLLPSGHVIETDRSKLVGTTIGSTAPKTDQVIDSAMGGILFIDEAYTLSPDDASFDYGKEAIDQLLKRMEDDRGKFIVVVAGYTNEMRKFLNANPGLNSRFTKKIHFADYGPEEMVEIFTNMVKKKGLVLDEEAEANLLKFFKGIHISRDKNFGNAREVRNIFETAIQRQGNRLSKRFNEPDYDEKELKILKREDIEGVEAKTKSLDDILKELDEFIGMNSVKKAVREIAIQIKMQQERVNRGLADAEKLGMHFILTGNPGTGKTTITRKLGEVFKAIGFLPKGHVVEVDRSKLVGVYMGQTPELVNDACEQAMGGILFVDEAYTLAGDPLKGGDTYGKEAIETLMKRMEDDRGKFVVIAAGYKKEINDFLDTNPGMKSRFDRYLHIDDYTADELFEILLGMAKKKKYKIEENAKEEIKKKIIGMVSSKNKDFANAREVRKLFDTLVAKQSERVSRIPIEQCTDDLLCTITKDDIPSDGTKTMSIDEILKELNELTGMQNIKKELTGLIDYLAVEKERAKEGGAETKLNIHFVFSGNPGTGKTTVARLIGQIFKAIGLLPQGQVIEVDRSGLVGQFIGETEPKTNRAVNSALGGILFIDEAYTLASGGGNDFGKQAIDILLKRMEDDRGKFVCIVAGYTNQMNAFLDMNPGLASRFTKRIEFTDYTADELLDIFVNNVKKKQLILDLTAQENLKSYFDEIYNKRDKNFGNAREVRNIFEAAIQRQGARLAKLLKLPDFDRKLLNVLTFGDITGNYDLYPENYGYIFDQKEVEKEALPTQNLNNENLNDNKQSNSEVDLFDFGEKLKLYANLIDFLRTCQNLLKQYKSGSIQLENVKRYCGNLLIFDEDSYIKKIFLDYYAKILNAFEFLPSDKVTYLNAAKLKSGNEEEIEDTVNNLIDDVLGGILCIENTQDLITNSFDFSGKQASNTLIERMIRDEGKFILVFSGDKYKMSNFVDYSSYVEDKFAETIKIPKLEAESDSKEYYPEDFIYELNSLIGLSEIKIFFAQMVKLLQLEKEKETNFGIKSNLNTNLIFIGNAGTGKTTVAKLYAKLLKSMGFLENSSIIIKDKTAFVSTYSGQSSILVEETINKSRGSLILFKNAFELTSDSPTSQEIEARDKLKQKLVEEQGRFCLILSGSKPEMELFMQREFYLTQSHFLKVLYFPDYSSEEIYDMFIKKFDSCKISLNPSIKSKLKSLIENNKINNSKKFLSMAEKIIENCKRKGVREISEEEIVL